MSISNWNTHDTKSVKDATWRIESDSLQVECLHNGETMNWGAISAIIRKDVVVALHTRAVSVPLIIVPAFIILAVPLLVGFLANVAVTTPMAAAEFEELQVMIPPELMAAFHDKTPMQAGLIFFLVYMFAPMYLILPMMVSAVVAADSFAGEKERKTMEALAYTPTTDGELLLAKMLGGWIPGVAVGVFGFVLYCTAANIAAWPLVGELILPNTLWWLLGFWVGPAAAGLGLGVTVLISARVNTFQEAYQMGGLVVIPVMILMLAQVSGALFLSPLVAVAIGLVLWLTDLGIYFIGRRVFKRSEWVARLS
jgi:ABC-2 type transport system permease protein